MTKIFTATICLLVLAACRQDNSLPNGCIERFTIAVTDHSVNPIDITTIDSLFKNNNIDNKRFRYYRYLHETTQTNYFPFSFDSKSVRIDQFLNGVRLFNGDMVYHFKNDTLNFTGGNLVTETLLNTTPHSQLKQLRQYYLDDVQNKEHLGDQFKDSCLEAEFGYYNLGQPSNTQNQLAKAWKVTPKNGEYPACYYIDGSRILVAYSPLMIN